MTTYKIESCYVTDAARNNMAAFLGTRPTKCQPRNLLRDLEKVRHEKADDPVTGTIVGYARWILPSGMAGSTGAGYECGREQTVSGTGGISPVGMRGDMAAHPRNKGKWIGTALVTSGMRYAEMAGAPIFCMAFKAECGVYARLGFKEVELIMQDDSQYGGAGEYGACFMMYDVPQKV
ncbi:hypothetical protein BDV23DRAFT_175030 [Aspergillus alliaceus]|uniref:N-acetyltransferase domain-containing protein n=1 Tax=Petromyces alliaceus TaxID=209559 RepID=A0A5N7BYT4_PETAA|nr:hypothetical protein BDV23DRAFT_175030 [Aspergillus alliaceus]